MILQNKDNENIIFIENDNDFIIKLGDEFDDITFDYSPVFKINNSVHFEINEIQYNKEDNKLILLYGQMPKTVISLEENEIVSIEKEKERNVVNISIFKIPLFLLNLKDEDDFPKFDIHISECQYSMKIYITESEYIDIPVYMSHYNIIDTLKYIEELVEFLTKKDEYFIAQLCGHEMMALSIITNGEVKSDLLEYRLTDNGVVLLSEAFDNGFEVINWHEFFKLVIDKKWIVNFISKDE